LSEQDPFEQFMTKVMQRPLPDNPMARIRMLAKELAEGAVEGIWDADFRVFRGALIGDNILVYVERRWKEAKFPALGLLVSNGYFSVPDDQTVALTQAAFRLLDQVEPASIFISYRRSDSSAFALLVLARLKAAGLEAFLDLTIQPGENWRNHIREQITSRGYFILLLGKETLSSDVVLEEIGWALESGSAVIPIWHNGYKYRSGEFNVPPEIDHALQITHTIRVLEERVAPQNNVVTG